MYNLLNVVLQKYLHVSYTQYRIIKAIASLLPV